MSYKTKHKEKRLRYFERHQILIMRLPAFFIRFAFYIGRITMNKFEILNIKYNTVKSFPYKNIL